MTTKADLLRFAQLQSLGCVACLHNGNYSEPDIHHLLSGGRRRGHQFTIPLCPAHHRGVAHDPELHGPSLALSPKSFRQAFGTDEELLERTNDLIGVFYGQ
jgi:hypothetical protein